MRHSRDMQESLKRLSQEMLARTMGDEEYSNADWANISMYAALRTNMDYKEFDAVIKALSSDRGIYLDDDGEYFIDVIEDEL